MRQPKSNPLDQHNINLWKHFQVDGHENTSHNHSPGAVKGRDGISVVLGMLQKLLNIVSGNDTGGDVAGGNHC